ncbi:MAG: hypothetical protein ISN29_11255, partial [Gammaproteobacteria bacterium AqS3]|nr:hypothetical protein [Gammaproteobacteria bacterium AqS3]
MDAPGDSATGWWSKIGNAASDCSGSYDPTDNFEASGGTYSKTFTGNAGKYICIRHRRPDLNSFTNEVIITTGSALITYPPDNTAPTVTAAGVNGTTLTVTFSEAMSSSKAANSAWSVSAGGSAISVSSYTLSGTTATLTLASAVNPGQTVTLGYTKPGSGSKLQDTRSNDLATFSNQSVTNNTPYPTVEAERSTNQLTIYEGETATFTYVLKANPYADRTIQIEPDHDDLKIVKGDGTKVDELTLTFTADNWDDAQTVTLSVEHDADRSDIQGAQDVNFTLGDKLTHASGSNATLTVQMLDDDASPALTLSETSLTVDEDGSDTFTVRLAGRPSANVTVSLVQQSNAANSEVTFSPASLSFTTSNWHTTQTVTVNAAEDDDAGDDIATISLNASGGDYGSVTGSVTITVDDDDDIDGVRASFNPVNLADVTATEGSIIARSLALGRRPDANVTVALASTNSEVTFASNAAGTTAITQLSFTRSNWNTAQTFYTVLGDDSDSN